MIQWLRRCWNVLTKIPGLPALPQPLICQGEWAGEILEAPQGDQGFGYDPLFFVPSDGQSSAELPRARKNALSHRGQALQQLKGRIAGVLHG